MSWLNNAGNDLGDAINNLTDNVQGIANAAHTLLGSGGTIYENGQPLISTGVTHGDVVTTRHTKKNITEMHGFLSEITSNPLILGIIVIAFVVLVSKK